MRIRTSDEPSEPSAHRDAATRLLLDNVQQGFAILDAEGRLSEVRSAAFDRWFGVPGPGVGLAAHLAGAGSDFEAVYELAWESVQEGFMPLSVSMSQFPTSLSRRGHSYTLGWQAVTRGGEFEGILLVVDDVTAELEREQADRDQRELVRAFWASREDRAGFDGFIAEASRIAGMLRREGITTEPEVLQRRVHTLKGNAGLFGIDSVGEPCHRLEERLQQGEAPRMDEILAVVGAWHSFMERTEVLRSDHDHVRIPARSWDALRLRVQAGDSGASLLEHLDELTLERVQERLEGLARRAERLAMTLGKEVVSLVDGRVGVPAGVLDGFFGALVHAIRNAVDHGLEEPAEREALGKPHEGRLVLTARKGPLHALRLPGAASLGRPADAVSWIAITLSDDGRGVDWSAIRSKARAAGLPSDSASDLLRALCADGVSTAQAVSDVSGRGAGSSALLEEVLELGGVVELVTTRGQGTTFRYLLPLGAGEAAQVRSAA